MRAIAIMTAAVVTAPMFGQIEVYRGQRISAPIDCAEFCCLATFDPLQNCQEAGLTGGYPEQTQQNWTNEKSPDSGVGDRSAEQPDPFGLARGTIRTSALGTPGAWVG